MYSIETLLEEHSLVSQLGIPRADEPADEDEDEDVWSLFVWFVQQAKAQHVCETA